ncbi:hypothetical protein BCV69DRAFT_285087 [Microstroma glucosiphilum]|uniref:GPI mannosyltransferase 1 n=1 Tax=Pseudomicrostroma glucosiphilum TaxID=1684307 RepID=A0A316TYY6_9BASI|nr:hypothetical protein BCV69DRAFT_285087 [Pseudomicrostroma glucosiphilum]PWN18459.1 hypothetical protein BCV69DRAFT_285087 [Pseudomicrostroma glucosiphilum]
MAPTTPLLTRNRLTYLLLGLALRLLLLFVGLVTDARNPSLPYTDVDYHVFTSGASHLVHGCPISAAVPPHQADPWDTLQEFTDPPGTTKDACAKGWLAIGARYILQHEDVLTARSAGAGPAEEKRKELGDEAALSLIPPNRIETVLLPVSMAVLRPFLKPLAAMGNPYARPTFRYTPLLAILMSPGAWAGPGSFAENIWGKLLFVLADLAAGVLMWDIALRRKRARGRVNAPAPTSFPASVFGKGGSLPRLLSQPTHSVGLLWLLNPFPAQIATRGSSEAILCVAILAFVNSATMLVEGLGIGDDDDGLDGVIVVDGKAFDGNAQEEKAAPQEKKQYLSAQPLSKVNEDDDGASSASTDDNSTIRPDAPSSPADAQTSAAPLSYPQSSLPSLPLPTLPIPLLVAPLLLALAAHLKLFPIFFGVPVLSALLLRTDGEGLRRGARWSDAALFALISAYAFLGVALGLWMIWGQPYLDNTFLYHLTRLDHRHNFSPYFLPLYLIHTPAISGTGSLSGGAAAAETAASWTRLGSFAPQILVVVYIGYKLGRKGDVLAACAAQSMAFVVLNKVATSQYFLWYLPFLPPLLPSLSPTSPTQSYLLLGVWLLTQILWLSQAYLLEMQAQDVFLRVWAAGLVYMVGMGWVLMGVLETWERGRREMIMEEEEEEKREREEEKERSAKENGKSVGQEVREEIEAKANEVPDARRGDAQSAQQQQQQQQQSPHPDDVKAAPVANEVR